MPHIRSHIGRVVKCSGSYHLEHLNLVGSPKLRRFRELDALWVWRTIIVRHGHHNGQSRQETIKGGTNLGFYKTQPNSSCNAILEPSII